MATNSKASFNKVAARRWMQGNLASHTSHGEVNMTSLAEECAAEFGVNGIGGVLDDETHWIWEVAAEFSKD